MPGEFIKESREHLTTIEADLPAIEEGGADIDLELVNKVFRAAHSIGTAEVSKGIAQDIPGVNAAVVDIRKSGENVQISAAELSNPAEQQGAPVVQFHVYGAGRSGPLSAEPEWPADAEDARRI